MSNEANSSREDEKTTKLRKAKKIVEEDNVNETASLQVITLAETPQPEKISSNGHLPDTPHIEEAQSLSLEIKELKREAKQKTQETPVQKLQPQPRAAKRATEEVRVLR